ncbi:MAG: type II toxin-antitoxin system PemK/MazF family toxin [Bacillota bacterium]
MMKPSRGEIWLVDLNPVKGHEQAGTRPALVISVDLFNQGPAELAIVLPITTQNKNIPLHVKVDPPDGGMKKVSFIKCEDIRSLSSERLITRLGAVSTPTMSLVEDRLRILLNL